MDRFRIGRAAELLGVGPDTVRRWIDEGKLASVRSPGGQRVIESGVLADFARTMADTPIPASQPSSSARNRFVGLVTAVTKDTVMAQVDIVAGRHRFVSLMSREAADELALEPGVVAVASVKATNVVVEIPASS